MRCPARICSIALAVALLGGAAQAQSINLGGIGIDLGSNGPISVTVETGRDGTPEAAVSLGGDASGNAGSGGSTVAGVSLGGGSDAAVGVDLGSSDGDGILGLGGSGGSGGSGGNGILGLGGSGGPVLFGSRNAPDASVGGDRLFAVGPGDDGDVNLKLFGDGRPDATVSTGANNVGLDVGGAGGSLLPSIGGGTEADVLLSLFGAGGGGAPGVSVNLGGAGETAATGGSGGSGGLPFLPSPGSGGSSAGNGGATQVASLSAPRGNCFTPNAQQIDYLLKSRSYSPSMAASWASARSIDLVPVRLCPQARARVAAAAAADAGIRWLQSAAERDPRIAARLRQAGLAGGNVLALDAGAGKLTVYVF